MGRYNPKHIKNQPKLINRNSTITSPRQKMENDFFDMHVTPKPPVSITENERKKITTNYEDALFCIETCIMEYYMYGVKKIRDIDVLTCITRLLWDKITWKSKKMHYNPEAKTKIKLSDIQQDIYDDILSTIEVIFLSKPSTVDIVESKSNISGSKPNNSNSKPNNSNSKPNNSNSKLNNSNSKPTISYSKSIIWKCFATIYESCIFWTRMYGRKGYLNYIKMSVPPKSELISIFAEEIPESYQFEYIEKGLDPFIGAFKEMILNDNDLEDDEFYGNDDFYKGDGLHNGDGFYDGDEFYHGKDILYFGDDISEEEFLEKYKNSKKKDFYSVGAGYVDSSSISSREEKRSLSRIIARQNEVRKDVYTKKELTGYGLVSDAMILFYEVSSLLNPQVSKRAINKNLPKIEKYLNQSLTKIPDNTEIYKSLMAINLYKKNFDECKILFEKITLKDKIKEPNDYDNQTILMWSAVLSESGKFKEANEFLESLLDKAKPEDKVTYMVQLGNYYCALQDHETGLKWYKKAQKINPEFDSLSLEIAKTIFIIEENKERNKTKEIDPVRTLYTNSYDFWELVSLTMHNIDTIYYINNKPLEKQLLGL